MDTVGGEDRFIDLARLEVAPFTGRGVHDNGDSLEHFLLPFGTRLTPLRIEDPSVAGDISHHDEFAGRPVACNHLASVPGIKPNVTFLRVNREFSDAMAEMKAIDFL